MCSFQYWGLTRVHYAHVFNNQAVTAKISLLKCSKIKGWHVYGEYYGCFFVSLGDIYKKMYIGILALWYTPCNPANKLMYSIQERPTVGACFYILPPVFLCFCFSIKKLELGFCCLITGKNKHVQLREDIENHLNSISINPLRHIKRKIGNPRGTVRTERKKKKKEENGKSVSCCVCCWLL